MTALEQLAENKQAIVCARRNGDEELCKRLSQERERLKLLAASRCCVCGTPLGTSKHKVVRKINRYCSLHDPHNLCSIFNKKRIPECV